VDPEALSIEWRAHGIDPWEIGSVLIDRRDTAATAGTIVGAILALAVGMALAAEPQQAAPFFRGKTVRVLVGSTAGGGLAAEARLLARYLPRYLPGSPSVVVEPTPGAGGLVAATLLARARPDGLTLAYLPMAPVSAQLLNPDSVRFDVRRFAFVGAPYASQHVCFFRRDSGVSSLEAWRASPRPLRMGATVPDGSMAFLARLLATTLSLPTQVVTGYPGSTEVRLALASGELDGVCTGWITVVRGWSSRSDVAVVLQSGLTPATDLPGVPLMKDVAPTPAARELLEAPLEALTALARFYVAPHGTPADRREALRLAMAKALADPAYLAEASTGLLVGDPLSGDVLEAHTRALFDLPPAALERLKHALGR
jgi:tripartite-type tricarboxylate transporter receptor subunit TctC